MTRTSNIDILGAIIISDEYTLCMAKTKEEVELFWELRNKYISEDILPCATFKPATPEDWEWFFSHEYKRQIMKLFNHETYTLRFVFLQKENIILGFCSYIIYGSEDGKCFILEFCVDKNHRNNGIGKLFFELIEAQALGEGAIYFALNLSNENNERFWIRNGFIKECRDENDADVYIARPAIMKGSHYDYRTCNGLEGL